MGGSTAFSMIGMTVIALLLGATLPNCLLFRPNQLLEPDKHPQYCLNSILILRVSCKTNGYITMCMCLYMGTLLCCTSCIVVIVILLLSSSGHELHKQHLRCDNKGVIGG